MTNPQHSLPEVPVVAALIWQGDTFFACQRPAHKARALHWEFPGGKVEPGETHAQALIRECQEELGCTLSVGSLFMDVVHQYPDITVHLYLYNCTLKEGTPRMLEHAAFAWLKKEDIPQYLFCPADEEILEKIKNTGESIADSNARTIDRWVEEGWEWGIPLSREAFQDALRGRWDMVLTPNIPVPKNWFPPLTGKEVLGLASGGGQQMPIFAALGANCTVLDYSPRQLESEAMVASREGYDIRILRADMSQPLPFEDESFDLIFHPVSNCYIREVKPLWRECFRILKPGGLLMAGLDNGINYLFDQDEQTLCHSLPFDPLINPEHKALLEKEDGGLQFSHTLEEQLRGQLQAGFTFLDMYEDTNGEGRLKDMNIPTFWATLAKKPTNKE